ncbi:probable sodium/metabolite cotransporter BASS1, chloroplastic [Gossypium arboreum]|uniref:probable sodium/metabolite cotransporter BASS1, chloroplastic n=1 Tax=Gossypium arboreum TaxID=29729 RepID=UPI00081965BE|nr:probable sodium/metabolite cotransporter BASS1, chloroplastic [Gossypium arboreum]
MSFTLTHRLCLSPPQRTHLRFTFKPHTSKPIVSSPSKLSYRPIVSSLSHNSEHLSVTQAKPRWENMLSTAASFYPLYVTVGGIVACFKPSAFAWFVERGPSSYSFSLGLIMLAMGLTLELKDLLNLFTQRPLSILFGCVAQYTIMPTFAMVISKTLGLSPSLSVGLILLGCCPGGAASTVVTFIARGDVSLSTVMTVCTTLGAVILTPLLTVILAGTYVPVDAIGLSISTLQVVVAPVLLGSYLQSTFPLVVKMITPFAPLFAVLLSSLLACSIFSGNVVRFKSSIVNASLASDASLVSRLQSLLSGDLSAVILSVMLLHFTGFFVGYISAAICRFREAERRAISIEVGMQNSSLGVVLATTHFTSPVVALPGAMSAVIMNIMGSSLGFFWRQISGSKQELEDQD